MIYVIRDEHHRYKVGYTRNRRLLRMRLANLQTAHSENLKLICAVDGDRDDEGRLHKFLCTARLAREWFSDQPRTHLVRNVVHLLQHYGAAFVLDHSPENIEAFVGIGPTFPRFAGLARKRR